MAPLLEYLLRIVTSLILLFIGLIIGILARKMCYKLLEFAELNSALRKANIVADAETFLSATLMYFIYAITVIMVLRNLGIASAIFYFILGLVITLIVLSSIVSLKNFIPNLRGWLYLRKQQLAKPGKTLSINGIGGEVQRIGYLETEIKTKNQDILHIPNAFFVGKHL